MAICYYVRGEQSFLVFFISVQILLMSLQTNALVSFHESKGRPFAGVLSSLRQNNADTSMVTGENRSSRRIVLNFIGKSILLPSSALIAGTFEPMLVSEAVAEENAVVVSSRLFTEMKDFVDPVGLFRVRVPKSYFVLRRSSKGDLPDPQTGQGRRGSSIFSAGDMTKAEIVAIERFPVKALLEEEGIDSSGDLSTFTSIGKPEAVANLIIRRRDRDNKRGQQQKTQTEILPPVAISPDDKTLMFTLKTTIEVMKPELLLEQTGSSQLVRVTLAKATLQSNDGQLMVIFASALQQDFDGTDGDALREVVSSFTVLDQSAR
jgi:hypothetical protein